MNESRQFDDLDIISILSFGIALKNLDLNVSQNDLQQIAKQLDRDLFHALSEIQNHLRIQDQKIDHIIELLEEKNEQVTDV